MDVIFRNNKTLRELTFLSAELDCTNTQRTRFSWMTEHETPEIYILKNYLTNRVIQKYTHGVVFEKLTHLHVTDTFLLQTCAQIDAQFPHTHTLTLPTIRHQTFTHTWQYMHTALPSLKTMSVDNAKAILCVRGGDTSGGMGGGVCD
eukprot:GDKI01034283.1.p1 GENE.GDKI01034283.1~~GDKI01034283.1.p1  ORF type:complete len:147 (+),score=42.04 GDKI01034283.1:278-718(+)